MVKDIESRQTNVGDFFLIESNCRVRRQSIARRTNARSGRATRQRQRPSDSQYCYGFRSTLSLRISLAMRHGGGLPFTPALLCNYITTTTATQRWSIDELEACFVVTDGPVKSCRMSITRTLSVITPLN